MGPKRTSDASASTQGEENPSDDVGDVSTLAAQLAELRALFEGSLAETRAVAEQALARATGEDAGSDGTPNVDDEKEHTSSAEKAEKAKELGTATDNANSKEEGKDDDAGELDYEDDGSGVEPATDNPFPRPPGHGTIEEPTLFDLRQELTYSSFRLAAQQRLHLVDGQIAHGLVVDGDEAVAGADAGVEGEALERRDDEHVVVDVLADRQPDAAVLARRADLQVLRLVDLRRRVSIKRPLGERENR